MSALLAGLFQTTVAEVAVKVPGATNIFLGDAANAGAVKNSAAKRKYNFMEL